MRTTLLRIAVLSTMLGAGSAHADESGRYDWSGFDGKLDHVLRRYLGHMQNNRQQQLNDLLDSLRKQGFQLPDQVDLNPDTMNVEFSKEFLEKAAELLRNLKSTGGIPEKRFENLSKQLDDARKLLEQPAKKAAIPPVKPPQIKNPLKDLKDFIPPKLDKLEPLDDDFTRWAKEQLEWAEDSKFGELFRDSPAFQEALRDLQRNWGQTVDGQDWRLQEWVRNVRMPDWKFDMPDNLRMPQWTPPRLPRFNINLPRFPSFRGRLPELSPPRLNAPNAVALGETLLWVLIFAAAVFLVWQLLKRTKLLQPATSTGALGPWPLDPRGIRTAADLIRAFEYLSLLRLGAVARTTHHLAIAENLAAADTSQRSAAIELARLYEQARYAPPVEALTPQAVETARKHICALAGVAL